MGRALVMASCVILSACGSLSSLSPSAVQLGGVVTPSNPGTLSYALNNLSPDETVILVDGKTVPFSIDLTLFGSLDKSDEYRLNFSLGRRRFHPFVIDTVGQGAETNIFVRATWFSKVSGISDKIKVALYRIDRSESGKTVTQTMIQEVKRTYEVTCDENRFFLTSAIRRWFGLCRVQPTTGATRAATTSRG